MNGLDASPGGATHEVLELGEQLLDWIEIGAVGRQEEQPRAGGPDDAAHGSALVGAEIVEHDDVARLQGFDELRFDIEAEGLAVDGPIEHPGCINAIMSQRGDEGHRLPMAIWRVGDKPLAARAPAT